jgi:hypothetical protein
MKLNLTIMKPTLTLLTILLFALITTMVTAADFHVAPSGSDANPGTKDKPFATIQAGVNQLHPGDTLLIHAGTYRETIIFPRSGTATKPITVKPHPGEKPIVSGCDPVSGWTKHKDTIWKAPMEWTLGLGRNQVFTADEVMIEARFPNQPSPGLEMHVSGLSTLWPTFGEFTIPEETRSSDPGRIVSKLLEGQPDDYWKGALYLGVHYEGWSTQSGVIEGSKSGEIHVGDRKKVWWFGPKHGNWLYKQEHQDGRGMIVGHMNALDQPREWVWQDNTLSFIAPDGGEPRGVEAKRRALAFDLSGRSHIVINGLTVHAASARLEDSSFCTFDGCSFAYIAHHLHETGYRQIAKGRDTVTSGETGIYVSGHDNRFLNCSIRFSSAAGLHIAGLRQTVHNCLIDEINYAGGGMSFWSLTQWSAPDFYYGGHTFTYNTLANAGRAWTASVGDNWVGAGRTRAAYPTLASLFAHNHGYNCLLLTRDAGGLSGGGSSGGNLNRVRGQEIYNVLHDCYDTASMRLSEGGALQIMGSAYHDQGSCDLDFQHNLLWAAPGSHQAGWWFNTAAVNVRTDDNVFHPNFTRTSAELTASDFPGGKPFRFGHDFADPPALPKWPQLVAQDLPVTSCSLTDGDVVDLGLVDFNDGWQSAILRFACTAKGINGVPTYGKAKADGSAGPKPRHECATDPLVLDSIQNDEVSTGIKKRWTFLVISNNAFVRFNQVPLGDGYQRLRVVYGNDNHAPAKVEVRLDRADGPMVGEVALPQSDTPKGFPIGDGRGDGVCIYNAAIADLSAQATGTHDVFLVFRSESEKRSMNFEYLRFEQYRGLIPLQQNEVKLELRADGKDGQKLGEFYPRFTGGAETFREWAANLEPMEGEQKLFLVVRSSLTKPVGTLAGLRLEKSPAQLDQTGIGAPPLMRDGKMVFPEPTNLPQSRPNDRFIRKPPTENK